MEKVAFLWWKVGDHLEEGGQLIAKFVAEMGQEAADDEVSVRRASTPSGTMMTFLLASHPWWHEQMHVHSNGWAGASLIDVATRFGL